MTWNDPLLKNMSAPVPVWMMLMNYFQTSKFTNLVLIKCKVRDLWHPTNLINSVRLHCYSTCTQKYNIYYSRVFCVDDYWFICVISSPLHDYAFVNISMTYECNKYLQSLIFCKMQICHPDLNQILLWFLFQAGQWKFPFGLNVEGKPVLINDLHIMINYNYISVQFLTEFQMLVFM